MDELDDLAIKAEIDGISKRINEIVDKLKTFEPDSKEDNVPDTDQYFNSWKGIKPKAVREFLLKSQNLMPVKAKIMSPFQTIGSFLKDSNADGINRRMRTCWSRWIIFI